MAFYQVQPPMVMNINRLLDEVRAVLVREWDPIGIRDVPQAQDEYDTYARHILRVFKGSADKDKLAQYLRESEVVDFGLPVDFTRTNRAAIALEKILG